MIIDTSKTEYRETFRKKFLSFCERAPIYISFSIVGDNVVLDVRKGISEKVLKFLIDEEKPVGRFILEIRTYLKQHEYPVLSREVESFRDPPVDELTAYMRDHSCDFSEAFTVLSRAKSTLDYKIDKVNLKQNQIILESSRGEQFLYQLKMPVIIFLKKYSRGELTPSEAYDLLNKDGKFLYKIERRQK